MQAVQSVGLGRAVQLVEDRAAPSMTEAAQEFYSGIRVTIGATMEHDSYTDISLETASTVKDLPRN